MARPTQELTSLLCNRKRLTSQNSARGDSRQFRSSLRSPQSLSKSHRQTLLMQFPLLQRCWLRRQALSVGGRREKQSRVTLTRTSPSLPSFHFSSSRACREGKAGERCTPGRGLAGLFARPVTLQGEARRGVQPGTMVNKDSDDANWASGVENPYTDVRTLITPSDTASARCSNTRAQCLHSYMYPM